MVLLYTISVEKSIINNDYFLFFLMNTACYGKIITEKLYCIKAKNI